MVRKIIIIFSLFLSFSHSQFTMLRHLSKKLQKSNSLQINSVFTSEFIRLSSCSRDSISQVSLLSQIVLDKDLENKIFKLAVEQDADIKMLVSKSLLKDQYDMLEDMQQDGIEVKVLPNKDGSLSWQEFFLKNNLPFNFNIHDDLISSSIMAAFISYHSGKNIILIGKERATLSMYDHKDFSDWQKRFDSLFIKSR